MWIKTTTPFWDLQNPADEPVPADKSLNVTAERGAELIDAGLAVAGVADPEPDHQPDPAPAG